MAFLDRFFTSAGGSTDGPSRIGAYTLTKPIAHSAMSTVYLGTGPDGKQVAVKVLSPHGNRIAEKLSVKLGKPWEGEKARALDHPNVVRTIECGKEKGGYYIVMEYLSGGNMAEHLRVRTPAIIARRLEIMTAAANGLAYVHEKGIIHRDVCPKNLMFDSEGTVKLIDFGVSILTSDRLKQTDVRTGRPSYLAPELIRHNRFNVQTDIYAFGVALYEVFTGRRPFTADSREDLMNLHLRAEPLPPSHIDSSIPPAVDRVVLTALEKEPQRRYSSMRQVVAALARLKGIAV